jgi:hypothetical protein
MSVGKYSVDGALAPINDANGAPLLTQEEIASCASIGVSTVSELLATLQSFPTVVRDVLELKRSAELFDELKDGLDGPGSKEFLTALDTPPVKRQYMQMPKEWLDRAQRRLDGKANERGD